jgi:A/G-specific adenine glycosylase
MLQQTTVAHATPYWKRFCKTFPTVCDLARAPSDQVMGLWAGLGYYARARNLHKCAQKVCDELSGVFPTDEATLLTLPGIGPYTAAAIAAICAGEATNVVDGNVERVISRLFTVQTPLPKGRKILRNLAGTLVRPERAGDYPQALMDLGATVCRPKNPDCEACPVNALCKAKAEREPTRYPLKIRKTPIPTRYGHIYVSVRGDKVWLTRRAETGLLGGTLGFPTSDWADVLPDTATADWKAAPAIRHTFSHFHLELSVWIGEEPRGEGDWHPHATTAQMPSLMQKAWRAAKTIL